MAHDHPATRPDVVALGAHAAGWLALLATVFLVRLGIGELGLLVAVIVVGVALFAALVAWSATRLITMSLLAERRPMIAGTSRPLVDRSDPIRVPVELVRPPMSSPVGGSYGRTTIVARVEPVECRLAA